jgi:hypothetical protein
MSDSQNRTDDEQEPQVTRLPAERWFAHSRNLRRLRIRYECYPEIPPAGHVRLLNALLERDRKSF